MSSLRGDAPAFVPPAKAHAGVVCAAPIWLLEDSDDEDSDSDDHMVGRIVKDIDSDSGMASTDDCGATTDEESDSDQEEQQEPAMAPQNPSSAATSACSMAPSPFDELQAELSRARDHARVALEESRHLAAEARLVTELREARAQATQIAQNLEETGLSALEHAVSHSFQKDPLPQSQLENKELACVTSVSCLSVQESDETTGTGSSWSAEALSSKGSAMHFAGNCKSCSFFPMGRCDKGVNCPFCHLPHDRRLERKLRKKDRVAAVSQIVTATSDTERKMELDMAVRSELLRRLGTPPGLDLVFPPGLPL